MGLLIDKIQDWLNQDSARSLGLLAHRTKLTKRTLIAIVNGQSRATMSTALKITPIICESRSEANEILAFEFEPYKDFIHEAQFC